MTLFGKSLSDYVRFQKILLILTLAFGLLRLVLSMAGVPREFVTWFSMTGLLLISLVYYPIRVHMKGFGGYAQVLILIAIQNLVTQVMTAIGILTAPLTGVDNIFSVAAAGAGQVGHATSHLVTWPVFTVILWLPASVILWVTRRVLKQG